MTISLFRGTIWYYTKGGLIVARKRKQSSCLGSLLGIMIMIPLIPDLIILGCVKDLRPMNSKGAKISQAKRKGLF